MERRIPEKTRQGLCAGVAACDISEMSKIFQGCINTSQFRAQVLDLKLLFFFLIFFVQLGSQDVAVNSCVDNLSDPGTSDISKRFACFCNTNG